MPWGKACRLAEHVFAGDTICVAAGLPFLERADCGDKRLYSVRDLAGRFFKKACLIAAGIFLANAAFGAVRLAVLSGRHYGERKGCRYRGNLPSYEEVEKRRAETPLTSSWRLSEQAAIEGAKIIRVAGDRHPVYIEQDNFYDKAYRQFAKEHSVYLIAGGFVRGTGRATAPS